MSNGDVFFSNSEVYLCSKYSIGHGSLRSSSSNQRFVINPKQLKQDECLVIKYDQHGNPVVIQKLKTRSLLGGSRFGRAESTILPGQKGRVFYDGSSWPAYCDGELAIHKGHTVLITAQRSLQLFVSPVEAPLEDFF